MSRSFSLSSDGVKNCKPGKYLEEKSSSNNEEILNVQYLENTMNGEECKSFLYIIFLYFIYI